MKTISLRTPTKQRKCKTCGEPELLGLSDSGDFGWFSTDTGTFCMRCGSNPERPRRSSRKDPK